MADFPTNWTLESVQSVPSTQDRLSELLADGCRDRWVVQAAEQFSGRGRRGAAWSSPRGGLWCSFSLLRPAPADPFIGLLVAAAARQTAAALCDTRPAPSIKWPNDLMIEEQKWGGVLVEVGPAEGARDCYRIGLGLNLCLGNDELPQVPPESTPPTSLQLIFGESPQPREFLCRLLRHVDDLLQIDEERGRAYSQEQLLPHIMTLGRDIQWNADDGSRQIGRALRLDPRGGLVVSRPNGEESILLAATIRHIRRLP